MARTIGELLVRVGADIKPMMQNLQKAEREINKAGKNIQGIGNSLMKISAPFVALSGVSIKMAMDFESSMTKMQSMVGLSAEEVNAFAADIKRMAAETGISANKAADAMFFITSAGLRGSDAVDALNVSLKASAVGLGEVQVVADLVTSAMNAYGSEVLGAEQATDILAAAVREGKLEADQLAGAMGAVLPIASNLGITFDEVGASFAAMSRTGTNASEAATQLRGIMTTLISPSKQAVDTLAEMGLTAEGLRANIRENGLLDTLQLLTNKFDGNIEATSAVFGNVRALTGVLDMMGAGAETTAEIFDSLTDTTDVLNDAFDITAETSAFKMQKAMESARIVAIDLGTSLLPLFSQLIGYAQQAADWFGKLDPKIMQNVVKIGLLVGGIGASIKVIGMMVTGIGSLIGVATKMYAAFKAVRAATIALNIALAANPVGLVIAAVVALIGTVAAVINWYDKWGAAATFLLGPIGAVINVVQSLRRHWDSVKEAFKTDGIMAGIKRLGLVILDALLMPLEQLLSLASKLPGIGDLAAGAAQKINDLRERLNLNSAEEAIQEITIQAIASTNASPSKTSTAGSGFNMSDFAPSASEGSGSKGKGSKEKGTAPDGRKPIVPTDYLDETKYIKGLGTINDKILENFRKGFSAENMPAIASIATNIDTVTDSMGALLERQANFTEVQRAVVDSNESVADSFDRMIAKFQDMAINGSVIEQVMASMADGIATAAMQGADSLKSFASAAVESGAKVIRSFIQQGVAGLVSKVLGTGPLGLIAAPVLAGIATGLFNRLLTKVQVPALASGGLAYGPTMAMVGDNPRANVDPEVISPLSKLKDIIGGTGQNTIKVEWPQSGFRLDGRDLVLVLDRNQNIARRTR